MDPVLLLEQDMPEATTCSFAGGSAALFSARCPGVERSNEDALALIAWPEEGGVALVADGAGGLPSGGQAAALAVEAVLTAVQEAASAGGSLREAILDGFERANRAILDLGTGAATTLAVIEVGHGWVRPYHAGDSQVLVCGQRGKLKLHTVSHSPVGYAVEAGLLDQQDALHHEDLHVVSNLLGSTDMRIELGATLKVAKLDTVVLGSDGLFDNVHVPEIVDRVRLGPLARAARSLAELGRKRMVGGDGDGHPSKPDDLSFIILRPGR